MPPVVSVVMPVRNGLPYLEESIDSILHQTFTDFEFIILDNGSTDGTSSVLDHFRRLDPRVNVATTLGPAGLALSSQEVAGRARGDLIARMDADDISSQSRLE